MNKPLFDEKEIKKTLLLLKGEGRIFEIRMMDSDKHIQSGYFNNIDDAVKEIKRVIARGWQVYVTLNELVSGMSSREQFGRIQKLGNRPATGKKDVEGYDWLFIDLDPDRSTGISSTKEELQSAKELGNKIYKFLKNVGFEEPITAFSGNGVHLLYKIYLENDEASEKIVSDVLDTLNILFSTENIKVDIKNKDANRVCKLYGTLAQKGRDTEERPHRMSKIVYAPNVIKETSLAYLEKLISMRPQMEERKRYNNYSPTEFDLEQWLSDHYLHYKTASYDGGTKYILDCCPFDSNHKGKDAVIIRSRNGAIGFHCFHNSCAGKTWKDVRVLFEPDAYEKKWKEQEQKMYRTFNRDKLKESKPIVEKENAPLFFTSKDIYNMPHVEETFVKTGVIGIDRKVRGLKKGFCSLWSGLRGSAKSTILSEIILNAVDEGNNVACFSGELSPRNFMRWMNLQAAGKSNVKEGKYEGYYYVDKETQEKIADWMESNFWLYNNDYGNDSKAVLELFDKTIQEKKLDLLILDNLMAFDLSTLNESKWESQKDFIWELHRIAQKHEVHIALVAHPRKAMGFLRLDDVSGSADLTNAVEYAFIVHRNNNDFKRLTQQMFGWKEGDSIYECTNVIEICKDRDGGTQDYFVPLWYEFETKRLKNSITENVIYGWNKDDDGFASIDQMEIPFD